MTLRTLILLALAAPAAAQPLAADLPPGGPVHVVAHVDVTQDHTAQAIGAIGAYVAGARREPGAIRVEAMEETRPNHFDLIEVWRDRAAYDAHAAAPATIRFHDAIFPWRGSPLDERLGAEIAPAADAVVSPG